MKVLEAIWAPSIGIVGRAKVRQRFVFSLNRALLSAFLCLQGTVLAVFPQRESPHYREAIEKYRAKDYTAALAAAQRALQEDGNNASNVHIYGLTQAALGQFAEAEENLQKAIALEPAEPSFHYDYGYVLYQQKKYDQSVPVLKRAVELDGENLMARYLLGKAYVICHGSLHIDKFGELSLEQFKFIAEKNPRFPTVHLHMGMIYANAGDQDKALQELTTELELYPRNVQARLEIGEILLKRGEIDKAYEHLVQAEKEAPTIAMVHYNLAMVYRKKAQTAEAIKAAQRCIELDPNFAEGHYLLSQLYRQSGQAELARQEMALFQEIKKKGIASPGFGHQ
jgi:tetratricopeptide (TPR) repeat protein